MHSISPRIGEFQENLQLIIIVTGMIIFLKLEIIFILWVLYSEKIDIASISKAVTI